MNCFFYWLLGCHFLSLVLVYLPPGKIIKGVSSASKAVGVNPLTESSGNEAIMHKGLKLSLKGVYNDIIVI
jgi:hypothetical protein